MTQFMVVEEEESIHGGRGRRISFCCCGIGPWRKALYSAHVDAAMADLKELISDEGNLGVTKRSSDDLITLCSSNGYLVFLFHDAFLNCYCCLAADPLLREIYVSSYSRHSRGFPSLEIQENYWSDDICDDHVDWILDQFFCWLQCNREWWKNQYVP